MPQRILVEADSAVWWASLEVLHRQVGVRERTGRNDGVMVERYLASVNLAVGNPWCMAIIIWSYLEVSKHIPLVRSGHCRTVWNAALRNGRRVKGTFDTIVSAGKRVALTPLDISRDGDVLIWGYVTSSSGHAERQVRSHGHGWVTTIGGNTTGGNAMGGNAATATTGNAATATGSQRDGDGVYYRRRNVRHLLARMILLGAIGPRYAARMAGRVQRRV